jgi:hypothetical protein
MESSTLVSLRLRGEESNHSRRHSNTLRLDHTPARDFEVLSSVPLPQAARELFNVLLSCVSALKLGDIIHPTYLWSLLVRF